MRNRRGEPIMRPFRAPSTNPGATLSERQRLTTDRTFALPTSQFTPTQQLFRDTLGAGRWQADIQWGQHPGGACKVDVTPDGCRLTQLEAVDDGWCDLPGPPIRVVVAGRP